MGYNLRLQAVEVGKKRRVLADDFLVKKEGG